MILAGLGIFPLLMAVAAASDLLTMTISNRLTAGTALCFLPMALLAGMGLPEIGMHLAVGFVLLLVGIGLFAMGWFGGGDAKLVAAIGVWLGPSQALLVAFLVASLVGGGLALALISMRKVPLPAFALGWGWLLRLHDKNTGVPYGIALAAGALVAYSEAPIFHALLRAAA